jgi:putative transposase
VDTSLAPDLDAALHVRWEPVYRSQLHYLVTWSTRGRRPVLKPNHVRSLRELIPALCEERGIPLVELAIGQDHVHVLFGLRPAQSVATAVREIKSHAGMSLIARHPELRVWLGGNLVWDDRYSVETVSAARIGRIQERLRNIHGGSEPLARAS